MSMFTPCFCPVERTFQWYSLRRCCRKPTLKSRLCLHNCPWGNRSLGEKSVYPVVRRDVEIGSLEFQNIQRHFSRCSPVHGVPVATGLIMDSVTTQMASHTTQAAVDDDGTAAAELQAEHQTHNCKQRPVYILSQQIGSAL
jgi:hypothetical protein